MLRVTVELLPGHRIVADLEVINTGEGDASHGHYAVTGHEGGRSLRRASVGLVKRNATAPLSLLARGLHALGYIVPEPPKDTDLGRCEARFRDYVARELSFCDADVESAVVEVFGKVKKR